MEEYPDTILAASPDRVILAAFSTLGGNAFSTIDSISALTLEGVTSDVVSFFNPMESIRTGNEFMGAALDAYYRGDYLEMAALSAGTLAMYVDAGVTVVGIGAVARGVIHGAARQAFKSATRVAKATSGRVKAAKLPARAATGPRPHTPRPPKPSTPDIPMTTRSASANPCNCFVAGTLVLVDDGDLVPIEDIVEGMEVYAENPETGEFGLREVVQTFIAQAEGLVEVSLGSTTITATLEHPFWVVGRGWVEAAELQPGHLVQTATGETIAVARVLVDPDATTTIHNFEVQSMHTYYVSSEMVLVHNTSCGDGVDLELNYMSTWTAAQRDAANAKVAALNGADTFVKGAVVRTRRAQSEFRRTANLSRSQDADHIVDLQLGGADDASNLWGLDMSVNRSLGSQINKLINNLPEGTNINQVRIVDP